MSSRTRYILITIVFAAVVGIIFRFFVSVEKIDAGCVGIKVNLIGDNRGVDDITEVTGWVLYIPMTTAIYEFPIYIQSKDYNEFTINAKDGTEFIVDPVFSYRVDRASAPEMFRKFRRTLPELEEGFIKMTIYDSYRIVANSYSSDSLMANRQIFEQEVQDKLSLVLKQNGFDFEGITSNVLPPQSLKEAIEAKNKATQEAIQAENKLRQAEATAKAKIIEAEAEKRVNDLKTSSLSPLIIQQMFIEKWDGKLPTYGETPKIFKQITDK